jgi:glycerol kinase
MVKSTYGTGCFIMLNTGDNFVPSSHRLLTTLAYRLNGKTSYALEGSIFMAGAAVQWLRDGLGIIEKASHCDAMAEASDLEQEVYLVPAFTGLGAPYWDANAQGLICGLTQSSGANEIARATLESVCYQTADLLKAMQDDWQKTTPTNAINKTLLRVDGGMTASNWTMQYLANIINATIDRPKVLETTALGAAWLAGSYAGVWKDQKEFSQDWKMDQQFTPDMDKKTRQKKKQGWQDAVKRTVSS